MLFTKGDSLTVSYLQKIFKTMFRKLNEVTARQVSALTTSQIIDIDDTLDTLQYDLVVLPMSVSAEQYFDSPFVPYYKVGPDRNIHAGNIDYLKYYKEEISELESL